MSLILIISMIATSLKVLTQTKFVLQEDPMNLLFNLGNEDTTGTVYLHNLKLFIYADNMYD
jgi:hypothetical protein